MDLRRISRALPSPENLNASEPFSFTDITPNILDALVPGYSIISKYVQAAFGIDISLFVSIAVISFAVTKGGQFLYNKLSRAFRFLFVSSVYIYQHDDLFGTMMEWVSTTQISPSRRNVLAKTRGAKAAEDFEGAANDVMSGGMFDYNKWSARTPPRYVPYYGRHILWHNGRPFLFRRSPKATALQSLQVRFGNANEDDLIQLDCIGRSVDPIKDMLKTAKTWSLAKQRNTTTIRHPTPKDKARNGGMWSKTFSRPSRPMDTVILDAEQKDMIVKDMNEYLHPSSPKWYATRGLPYRRGYLFYGPPGTGKTSLSFALAGIFGLEIYVISLQEPTLGESDLMGLFNSLPRRCIVLLEDVDAAGLIRDGKSDDSEKGRGKGRRKAKGGQKMDSETKSQQKQATDPSSKTDDDFTLKDLAKELRSIGAAKGGNEGNQSNPHRQAGAGISLSGLLNAIDGVASHEGRVLIMTTNHPERLDSALVRPGRVDWRVEFQRATKDQIEELFVRMYVSSDEDSSPKAAINGASKASLNGSTNGHLEEKQPNGQVVFDDFEEDHSVAAPASQLELEELAADFASHIPDDTFTPAEIQNHLMRYKKEPRTAVAKVDDWMRKQLAENEEEEESASREERGENEDED